MLALHTKVYLHIIFCVILISVLLFDFDGVLSIT